LKLVPNLPFITDILIKTSQYIQKNVSRNFSYTDVKGYLAEGDVAADKYIKNLVIEQFPNSLILSEEDTDKFSFDLSDDGYLWIVDPICGTANYCRNIPLYVHSLSVIDNKGVLYAGIYDPNRDELFLADRDKTTLNGKRVYTSQTKKLEDAFISVNCNQSVCKDGDMDITTIVSKFAPPITRRVKIFESANLELAYVACGRLDGYVNLSDKVWDIATGSLMVNSALGENRINGSLVPFDRNLKGIIASNQYLMGSLLRCLGKK